MSYTNRERLEHILDASSKVRAMMDGVSYDQFLSSEVKISAVSYKLIIIGEASSRLTETFRDKYEAEIPWFKIIGMRNLIVHDYLKPDPFIIWETATIDVPVLENKIKAILEDMP